MNGSQPRPLLEAFGWAGTARQDVLRKEAAPFFQTVLAWCAILIPVSVCLYLADLEPLFELKSVQLIHTDVIVSLMLLLVFARGLIRGFHGLPKKFSLALLFFFLASTVSAIFAEDKLRAMAAIIQMLEFVAITW